MNKRRIIFAAGLVACVSGLLILGGGDVAAQDPAPPGGSPEVIDFDRTALEDEVYTLYNDNKLLTARRKVEELLEADPDSMVGHYVFGNVLRQAEGSLPEAAQHLGRARELYETQWPVSAAPPPGAPWLLHREILYSMQVVAGEMEKHEYRLSMLDFYDSLYRPRLTAEHAWPLMRLGRFEEAREHANKAIQSMDAFQRSLGRNAMCALEGEANEREARFEACLAAFEDARERAKKDPISAPPDQRTNVAVHAYNAARAANSVLRPDEAERLAIAGTKRLEFTPANPWRVLVDVYTGQGRMDEAVQALREMQSWRTRQPAWLRDQARAETDATFAAAMLVAGETETGLQSATRALERPDRRGLSSSDPEQALGAHALLRRALLRAHAEVQAEEASFMGATRAYERVITAADDRLAAWADDERIISVLSDDDRLVATFRMYVQGGIEIVPAWLLGDLVAVLGPGVVAAVMERVRAEEDLPAMDPYYDAIDAEVALARGDELGTLHLAQLALDKLPETERLLQGRVAAVASRAAQSDGARLGFLNTAMERDAGVVRRMGLSLPTRIEQRGSGAASDLALELLADSPRLDPGSTGFLVTVEGDAQSLSACIYSPQATLLSCAEVAVQVEGEDGPEDMNAEDHAAAVVQAFHRRAFSMPVVLSNVDLSSLDGTASVNEQAAREKMQGVLDGLVDGSN